MSYYQTVVNVPKVGDAFYTIEHRPICPLPQSKWQDKSSFEMEVENGLMRWEATGLIAESGPVSRFWIPKPTISDAVKNPYGPICTFTQFHSNGSVTARIHDVKYFWGA